MNPILNNRKNFIAFVSIWVLIFVWQFLFLRLFLEMPILYSLTEAFLFNITYSIVSVSIWYVVKYNSFSRGTLNLIFTHLLANVIIAFLWINLNNFIIGLFYDSEFYRHFLDSSVIVRYTCAAFFYSIFSLLYYNIIFYDNLKTKLKNELELEKLLKDARFDALKSQINPHFLFNSLNSISSLTFSNPKKAQEMIVKLSEFLRYSLNKTNLQKTTLEEELQNIDLYLDIEKIRFRDKLIINKQVDKSCLKLDVTVMILQPVIENAIKHGVCQSVDNIEIIIRSFIDNNILKLSVENEFDPTSISSGGEGVGLINIKNRMQNLYEKDNLVNISQVNNIFKVVFDIPLS